jgi:hypothetical protein
MSSLVTNFNFILSKLRKIICRRLHFAFSRIFILYMLMEKTLALAIQNGIRNAGYSYRIKNEQLGLVLCDATLWSNGR